MLVLHHLNNSRSQRVIWLLEELGLDYELVKYQRVPPLFRSPPELKKVSALGKSPVLVDGDITIVESGAIIEYIINRYGEGRLAYGPESPHYANYLMVMHFVEGTLACMLILGLVNKMVGGNKLLVRKISEEEVKKASKFLEDKLGDNDYLINNEFSAADIQFWFFLESMIENEKVSGKKELPQQYYDYLERLHQRPAYQRAIEKGGKFDLSVFSKVQNDSMIKTILKSIFSGKKG